MARIGSLSKKTYFPIKGDQLEVHSEDKNESGYLWEVMKVHTFQDPTTEEKYTYALLLLRHPDYEGEPPLPKIFVKTHERDELLELLEEVSVIIRFKGEEELVYEYEESTETWRQA